MFFSEVILSRRLSGVVAGCFQGGARWFLRRVLPRLTRSLCEEIHRTLLVIKSEVVLQLLSSPEMVGCRVVDNRKTLSTAGALASKRSGVSETAR